MTTTETTATTDTGNVAVGPELLLAMARGHAAWAKYLRHWQQRQLEIAPEWTTVELDPELFDKLVAQLKRCAAGLESLLQDAGSP